MVFSTLFKGWARDSEMETQISESSDLHKDCESRPCEKSSGIRQQKAWRSVLAHLGFHAGFTYYFFSHASQETQHPHKAALPPFLRQMWGRDGEISMFYVLVYETKVYYSKKRVSLIVCLQCAVLHISHFLLIFKSIKTTIRQLSVFNFLS
jgi:hypothetical protein